MTDKTSTGLQTNIAGLLCYLLGWITGVIFFILEKDNRFIRFHAMQSILVFGSLTVLSIVISILQGIFLLSGYLAFIAVILGFISSLIWIAGLILWVVLMAKAYQNESFKLPYFGELAEKYI